jgi:hypothetical protein
MNFYDLDEIKEKADCIDVASNLLHLKVNKDRCAATWRGGSNETAVHLNKFGFYDHGTTEADPHHKGSVIDLVMLANNVDLTTASEVLGDYLGLTKSKHLKDSAKVVAEYVYTDMNGNPLHKTLRFEPKSFAQYRYDNGKWVPDLADMELVPYNLPDIVDAEVILFNEGEKDAETGKQWGFPSTTIAQGAEKWRPEYNKWFKGKKLIIVADNDDKGKAHAIRVCSELKHDILGAKIVIPSKREKGDLSDFKADGGTKEQFTQEILATAPVNLKSLPEPEKKVEENEKDSALKKAKKLNQKAFKNYRWETESKTDGSEKKVKVPLNANELVTELRERLLGYPQRIGSELFDMERDSKKITLLHDMADLFAWISRKTGHNAYWSGGNGFTTKQELYAALSHTAQTYDTFSNSPEYPMQNDTYYLYGEMPEPSSEHIYFKEFCCFFCPATVADTLLLQAMFASLVYFQDGAKRPMWVIDTVTGDAQATGKTTLAEICALLIGGFESGYGEPFWVRPKEATSEQSLAGVTRRMLSGDGRKKKLFLIDNVDNFYKSAALASFVTQGTFSGMAPYGHGETTRKNNMTFMITCNGATLGKDIISRSMFLQLKKPAKFKKDWEIKVRKFIKEKRLHILADIIDMLKRGATFDITGQTRFKEWEHAVLGAVCPDKRSYDFVINEIKRRKTDSDGEIVEADLIRETFEAKLSQYGCLPYKDYIWIPTKILQEWGAEAMPSLKYKVGAITHILNNHNKTGALPELSKVIEKYPTNTARGLPRTRGMMWCPEGIEMPKGHHAKVLTKEYGEIQKHD